MFQIILVSYIFDCLYWMFDSILQLLGMYCTFWVLTRIIYENVLVLNLSYTVLRLGTCSARYFQFLPPPHLHLYILLYMSGLMYTIEEDVWTLMRVYVTMNDRTHCTSEQTMRVQCTKIKTLSTHSVARITIYKHQRRSLYFVFFGLLFYLKIK